MITNGIHTGESQKMITHGIHTGESKKMITHGIHTRESKKNDNTWYSQPESTGKSLIFFLTDYIRYLHPDSKRKSRKILHRVFTMNMILIGQTGC